jgi:hypothetical protein
MQEINIVFIMSGAPVKAADLKITTCVLSTTANKIMFATCKRVLHFNSSFTMTLNASTATRLNQNSWTDTKSRARPVNIAINKDSGTPQTTPIHN